MRYAQGGGLTLKEQQSRERVRLEAGARFERREKTADIAAALRVGKRQVEKRRRTWREGGLDALRPAGPASAGRLAPRQWQRLEAELARGPAAHGWTDGQGWTLARIQALTGRLFHLRYTVAGVWKLLRRHGWSPQVPARRAAGRDEEAIAAQKAGVWPQIKGPRRTWAPGSAPGTKRGRG